MKTSEPAIFIVDDDASVSGALRRLMKSAGFSRVEVFGSAEEFLKHEVSEGGSVLILDLMLPGMSGTELQKLLRRTHLSASTVFISAHESELEKARKNCPEALAFLLKPFGGEELLKVVRSVFSNTDSRRKLFGGRVPGSDS
jgi:FixJ family two-component response regulator